MVDAGCLPAGAGLPAETQLDLGMGQGRVALSIPPPGCAGHRDGQACPLLQHG